MFQKVVVLRCVANKGVSSKGGVIEGVVSEKRGETIFLEKNGWEKYVEE